MLNENIDTLLEHINYEKIKDKENKCIYLILKSPQSIAASEQTKNINVANAILKYNHYSLKGNIPEKRNLLISIANEYDTFLHSSLGGYNKEFTKACNLINSLNIRHNNIDGRNKNKIVANMHKRELEIWYDELYQLILFCILAKKNADRMKKFDTELIHSIKDIGGNNE